MMSPDFHRLSIWRFPEIGVPPVIIHFSGISHYKPSIWGYPHDYGNPHLFSEVERPVVPSWLWNHFQVAPVDRTHSHSCGGNIAWLWALLWMPMGATWKWPYIVRHGPTLAGFVLQVPKRYHPNLITLDIDNTFGNSWFVASPSYCVTWGRQRLIRRPRRWQRRLQQSFWNGGHVLACERRQSGAFGHAAYCSMVPELTNYERCDIWVSCSILWLDILRCSFVRKALSVHKDHATSTSWDPRHFEDSPSGANNSRKFCIW